MAQGVNILALMSLLIALWLNKLECLTLAKFSTLIKHLRLLLELTPLHKYYTYLEKLSRSKHSSLFFHGMPFTTTKKADGFAFGKFLGSKV